MPFINVDEQLPGIRSLMAFRPDTAGPMSELSNKLLRSANGLSPAERELIATHVSSLNDCFYCNHSHGEIASIYLGNDRALVEHVRKDYGTAAISPKLKSLLKVAGKVKLGGKAVTVADIADARAAGATEHDIHDTVLIAASFCMFNRYVDGLRAYTPKDLSTYPPRAKQVADNGYGSHIYQSMQP